MVRSAPANRLTLALVAALVGLPLSGCLQNAAREIRPASIGSVKRHGVIVYGISVEQDWPWEAFSVELAKVDPATGDSGNCFRFDRTKGQVPPKIGQTHYFAYAVPEGHYTYSAMSGAGLRDWPATFRVSRGQRVYAGDYVLIDERTVERRDRRAEAERAVGSPLQGATFVDSKRPKPFLCTP